MCELFGYSAACENRINDYLTPFFKRSELHPHGWGLAHIFDGEMCIEKEACKANDSRYLSDVLSSPVITSVALAHIRLATVGNVDRKNCHPYTKKDRFGRRFTLIHNGTVFEYEPLNKYYAVQHGETDSERILLHLVDELDKKAEYVGRELNFEERFAIFEEIFSKMSKGNKLNLIFYDGEYFYIHSNFKDSLHWLKLGGALIFATEPLTRNTWQNVNLNTLYAVKDGEFVKQGTPHNNEFFHDEEAYRKLFLIYSNL